MVEKIARKRAPTPKKKHVIEQEESVPIAMHECGCSPYKCGGGSNDVAGLAYFLGVIGAAAYFISTATSFWMGVVGVLKALVWPAFLVYELMRMLGM